MSDIGDHVHMEWHYVLGCRVINETSQSFDRQEQCSRQYKAGSYRLGLIQSHALQIVVKALLHKTVGGEGEREADREVTSATESSNEIDKMSSQT